MDSSHYLIKAKIKRNKFAKNHLIILQKKDLEILKLYKSKNKKNNSKSTSSMIKLISIQ